MTDFKFNCPHCQQPLEVPEDMCGQQINCPSCSQAIKLPDPQFKNLDVRHKEPDTTNAPQQKNVQSQAEKEVKHAEKK